VSPRRFASVAEQISEQVGDAGRDVKGFEHGLNIWCGFGATRQTARPPLAAGGARVNHQRDRSARAAIPVGSCPIRTCVRLCG
jgi:hypothetical protein